MENVSKLLEEHNEEIKISNVEHKAISRLGRSDIGKVRSYYKKILPDKYRSIVAWSNRKGFKEVISFELFNKITSMPCYLCGTDAKIGIDRIDSTIGYVDDNVMPCCHKCNMMKYTHSIEDFKMHIEKIHRHIWR